MRLASFLTAINASTSPGWRPKNPNHPAYGRARPAVEITDAFVKFTKAGADLFA
jgi:hypothetical protein